MEIPNGTYRGKAKSQIGKLVESSNKETPGIAVEFEFQGQEGVLHTLTWTGWLSDAAQNRTFESLRICGWKGEDLDNVTGLDADVDLVIKNEEYEGSLYPKIAFVNRPGGALGQAMTAEKAKSFAAAMRDRIRAFDASKGQRKANGKSGALPPEPPPHTDEDFKAPF